MIADRPLLGVALMLGFCALAPLGDAIAKLLGATLPLVEIVAVRFLLQALILVPVLALAGAGLRRGLAMSPRVLRLTLMRTALHVAGIGAFFWALRFLPLAEAVAIVFVMPFIMLLLGRVVLDETVGPRRLAACAVGFVGTLLVVQPSFAAVGWPALLPLFVALDFALFMLITRQIAKQVDPVTLQAVSGLIASAVLVPLLVLAAPFDLPGLGLVPPGRVEALLLLAIGVIGTAAHLLMTWSLRFAPSATLAPMQYLEIPFATLFGWLIFRDLPDGLAAVGIAITMAAGLYILHRERLAARAAAPRRLRSSPARRSRAASGP